MVHKILYKENDLYSNDFIRYDWNWKKPLTLVRIFRGSCRPNAYESFSVDFHKNDKWHSLIVEKSNLPLYNDENRSCLIRQATFLGFLRSSYTFEHVPKVEITSKDIEEILLDLQGRDYE